jgi:hypothetical protein
LNSLVALKAQCFFRKLFTQKAVDFWLIAMSQIYTAPFDIGFDG